MDKIHIDWSNYLSDIDVLAEKIKNANLYLDGVYGPPRGGLIPAVILAHKLNLEYVDGVMLIFRKDCRQRILIVDDICDSGETFLPHRESSCVLSSVYIKSRERLVTPSFYSKELPDKWIVFPYEVNEEPRKSTPSSQLSMFIE